MVMEMESQWKKAIRQQDLLIIKKVRRTHSSSLIIKMMNPLRAKVERNISEAKILT
jgi:hypothetical protein